jgi:hypothetical protein
MKISDSRLNAINLVRIHIARLLQVSDEQKPVIYAQVLQGTDITNLNYWLEITFPSIL